MQEELGQEGESGNSIVAELMNEDLKNKINKKLLYDNFLK